MNLSTLLTEYNSEEKLPLLKEQIYQTIRKLEEKTNARWIIYWTSNFIKNSTSPTSFINSIVNEDLEDIRDIITSHNKKDTLYLVFTSAGGNLDATEALIYYFKESFNEINIIIPFMARSSAALLCLMADRLYMGTYSFIGNVGAFLMPFGIETIKLLKHYEEGKK